MNTVKIIFLDIDGVLNVIGQGHDEYGQIFHKHLENNLKWIIEETNAKIVISSTWRFSGLKIMKEMWAKRNIPGEVIDVTSDVVQLGINIDSKLNFYEMKERGHEIQSWIDSNKHLIESYVIIDDDNDMLDSQQQNFVKTSDNINHIDCVDIGYGLTKECARKAIEILNKSNI